MNAQKLKLYQLRINVGQIEGLPKNPRLIKDDRFASLVKSIQDDPEMLNLRELIVYPHGDTFVVIGGNMRFRAMKELGYAEAPCKVLDIDTPIAKLKAIALKDLRFNKKEFLYVRDALLSLGETFEEAVVYLLKHHNGQDND